MDFILEFSFSYIRGTLYYTNPLSILKLMHWFITYFLYYTKCLLIDNKFTFINTM